MKYVLDSSVAVKWVIPETDSPEALALREHFRKQIYELVAPDVLPIEVAHALTRAERQGRVSRVKGFVLWSEVMADCPFLFPSLPMMPRAYVLSSQMRIGVYDCLYVALAEREQCKVVTADKRVLAVFPAHTIALGSLP